MHLIELKMNLLYEELPNLTLHPKLEPSVFFDRCEEVAKEKGYGIDRRREYAGAGSDQLNLYVGGEPDVCPIIRMVSFPSLKDRLNIDVVDDQIDLVYDKYMPYALATCQKFLQEYAIKFGTKLRLGIPRRRPHFDLSIADFSSIPYAREKFELAIRDMVTGKGDVRERLRNAYLTIHMVSPDNLPEPLESELRWIYHELTKRPARWRGEGTVGATTAAMTRKKGEKIAEHILAIYDALVELEDRYCKKV
jgi:hypothetical protein